MKPLVLSIIISGLALAQDVPANSRAAGRGVTETERPSQSMDRGRAGSEASVPGKPLIWRGILVDAGCRDRSITNLRKPAAQAPAVAPVNRSADSADTSGGRAGKEGSVSSHGISVDEKTADAERSRPMETHTPDHLTRQMDPSCSISGDTRAFAMLLPKGTLLNLDEGGNTKAYELFQSNPAGRAIMNGKPGGEKPHAEIKGVRRGDTLNVLTIRLH